VIGLVWAGIKTWGTWSFSLSFAVAAYGWRADISEEDAHAQLLETESCVQKRGLY
jgi:hypothetical protein